MFFHRDRNESGMSLLVCFCLFVGGFEKEKESLPHNQED